MAIQTGLLGEFGHMVLAYLLGWMAIWFTTSTQNLPGQSCRRFSRKEIIMPTKNEPDLESHMEVQWWLQVQHQFLQLCQLRHRLQLQLLHLQWWRMLLLLVLGPFQTWLVVGMVVLPTLVEVMLHLPQP